jgi:hypothetical protein
MATERRFFSDESFWNQPIGPNPEIDPHSEEYLRALQEYGAVDVDAAKANTLYGEELNTQPGNTWDGILADWEMMKVPLKHYRVLKLGPIVEMGDDVRHKERYTDTWQPGERMGEICLPARRSR